MDSSYTPLFPPLPSHQNTFWNGEMDGLIMDSGEQSFHFQFDFHSEQKEKDFGRLKGLTHVTAPITFLRFFGAPLKISTNVKACVRV